MSNKRQLAELEQMLMDHLKGLMEQSQKSKRPSSTTGTSEVPAAVKSFLSAAAAGDRRRCQSFITGGGNPNVRGKKGVTALHLAAHEGHVLLIKELLTAKADIDVTDEDGDTPLINAVINRQDEAVELLIDRGANVRHLNNKGYSAADIALIKRSISVVTVLERVARCLQYDAQVHGKTLMGAAQEGNIRIIDFWLKNHPDRSACNQKLGQERTMAFIAALNGHLDIVQLLDSKGANLELTDDRGHTPLFCASQNDHFEVVQFLLRKRCNVNHVSVTGRTPIFSAVINGHEDIVRLLIRNGADVKAADEEGTTPLECAIKQGSIKIFRLLIDEGADLRHVEANGYDYVMIAASNQQIEMLRELHAFGLPMNQVNKKNGETALLGACQVGPEESVGFLIQECQADMNHQNKRGVSPALRAAFNGHLVILMALGESRAKLDLPNKINETAILCAAQKSSLEMVKYLHDKRCNISVKDDNGKTLAWYAAKEDCLELLQYLSEYGVPLDVPDSEGNTPLMQAVKANSDPETVRFLVNAGCSLSKQNQRGETAVDIAKRRSREELLKVLQTPRSRPGNRDVPPSPPPSPSPPANSIQAFNTWEITTEGPNGKKKVIGQGNFGKVYQARTDKGQMIAVKIVKLNDANDRHLRKIIEQEREVVENLKNFQHVNIVMFLKSELTQAQLCILSELITGASLSERMKRQNSSFSESDVKKFTVQICKAINFLHCRKPAILHRDIKCSNIMLTQDEVIKLIDFGLAKQVVTSQVAAISQVVSGTWYFMAPELFSNPIQVEYSSKSDVWAFGCTIFEMTHRDPPHREIRHELFPQFIQSNELPPLGGSFSADLCDFYRKCTARVPSERADTTALLQHRFLRQPSDQRDSRKDRKGPGAAAAEGAVTPRYGGLDPDFTKWDIIGDEEGKKKPIGSGGFGQVFKAYTDKHQFVAVKIVKLFGECNEQKLARAIELEKEGVEILKKLSHPNIVIFLKTERSTKGQFCIFTELISGISLSELMNRQKKPFDELGVRKFSLQICTALNFLHRRKPAILHRDIKCSNIMLNHEGVIKLIDFGLAKEIITTTVAVIGHQCGTPYFMAPELYNDEGQSRYTPKSDVWAFGCTVFELTAMEPPNRNKNRMALHIYLRNNPMPQLPGNFSADMCDFYRRCVTRDPDTRPDTTDLLDHAFLAN